MCARALRVGQNKAGGSLTHMAASVIKESFHWTINTLESTSHIALTVHVTRSNWGSPLRADGHLS